MPTELEIQALHNTLLTGAQTIQQKAILAAAKAQEHSEKREAKETLKSQLLSQVANARFDANNKLMYTNDDQRRAALIVAQEESTDYQTAVAEETAVAQEKAEAEIEAEVERKTYRANELLLLYYANNPA